jgi:hypothetical protein
MASDKDSITDLGKPVDVVVNAQSVMAYKLLRAKAKADTAELNRRAAMTRFRPSHMYPNVLYHDGLRWACEYVSGFGTQQEEEGTPFIAYGMFPEEAMQNFDAAWIGVETTPEQDDKEGLGDEDI